MGEVFQLLIQLLGVVLLLEEQRVDDLLVELD